ncbi:MAG: hypothetical protein QM756_34675 [Polyangiaceae bacterium]
MGVVRYSAECPGCKAGLTLRLGVGRDDRQPFFFVCPRCQAATRGALHLRERGGTELELSDGQLLDWNDRTDFTIHIHPEFPSVPDAPSLEQPGGSAFLTFFTMLGQERFLNFEAATQQLRSIVKSDWNALQRLNTYYIKRDWDRFDVTLRTVAPQFAELIADDWHRDAAVHNLYDVFLAPVCLLDPASLYLDMKTEWNGLWNPKDVHLRAMVAFARQEMATQAFNDVQRDLFVLLERYITNISALLPGLLCNLLPQEHQSKVDGSLRLFRDEYEILRDLYIQSFETCHKALRWVVGLANAKASGSADSFSVPSTASVAPRKTPKNLAEFSKLVSAEKRAWLCLIPSWDSAWDAIFDRKLRNDIGHASAHHNLASGMILREGSPPLAYTRFVSKAHRIIHGLLATMNALKILRIWSNTTCTQI